jgi:hypothetical protein
MASLIDYMLQTQNAIGANTKQDAENDKSIMMNQIYQQNPLLAISGSLPAGFAGQALIAQIAKGSPLTRDVGNQIDQYNRISTDALNARAQHNYNLVANAGERLAPNEVKLAMVNNLLNLGYNATQAQDILSRGYATSIINQGIQPEDFYKNMAAINPAGQPLYSQNPQNNLTQETAQSTAAQPVSIAQQLSGNNGIPSQPLQGLGGIQQGVSPLNAAQGQTTIAAPSSVGSMLTNSNGSVPVTAASITSTVPSGVPLNKAAQIASSQADKNIVQSKIEKDTNTTANLDQSLYNATAANLYNDVSQYLPSIKNYATYSGGFNSLLDKFKSGATGVSPQDYNNLLAFKNGIIPLASDVRRQYGGQATDSERAIMDEFVSGKIWDETPAQIQIKWDQVGNSINRQGQVLKQSIAERRANLGNNAIVQPASNSGSSPVDMIAPDGTHGSANPDKVKYLLSKGYRRANG